MPKTSPIVSSKLYRLLGSHHHVGTDDYWLHVESIDRPHVRAFKVDLEIYQAMVALMCRIKTSKKLPIIRLNPVEVVS